MPKAFPLKEKEKERKKNRKTKTRDPFTSVHSSPSLTGGLGLNWPKAWSGQAELQTEMKNQAWLSLALNPRG